MNRDTDQWLIINALRCYAEQCNANVSAASAGGAILLPRIRDRFKSQAKRASELADKLQREAEAQL